MGGTLGTGPLYVDDIEIVGLPAPPPPHPRGELRACLPRRGPCFGLSAVLAEATPIDPDAKKMLRATGTTSALGLEIAAYIAVAFLGGEYLDKQLGTAPWLKWILFVGGLGAAVKALVRIARSYQRSLAREARDDSARSDATRSKP